MVLLFYQTTLYVKLFDLRSFMRIWHFNISKLEFYFTMYVCCFRVVIYQENKGILVLRDGYKAFIVDSCFQKYLLRGAL